MNARLRVQGLAQGRGDGAGIAIPLALAPAARIQERDWEDFTEDPTQLANGLRDLLQAVGPDGLVVNDPAILLEQGANGLLKGFHAQASIEATRRLRASMGDQVALVACLPSPSDVDSGDLLDLGKEFLGAGADILLVLDDRPEAATALSTLANVARFHQGLVAVTGDAGGLIRAERFWLADPQPASGLAISADWLPRDTDLSELEEWVDAIRG